MALRREPPSTPAFPPEPGPAELRTASPFVLLLRIDLPPSQDQLDLKTLDAQLVESGKMIQRRAIRHCRLTSAPRPAPCTPANHPARPAPLRHAHTGGTSTPSKSQTTTFSSSSRSSSTGWASCGASASRRRCWRTSWARSGRATRRTRLSTTSGERCVVFCRVFAPEAPVRCLSGGGC